METVIKSIISEFPSPTKLDKASIKKIHKLLPVPSDFEILWANIDNWGEHPCGVVLTDYAIIIKSSKRIVNKENSIAYENWTASGKKEPKPNKMKYIYQMIPWDYYISDECNCAEAKDADGLRYDLAISGNIVYSSKSTAVYELLEKYNKLHKYGETNSVLSLDPIVEESTVNSLGFKDTLFAATYGSGNTKTGHGIYAEEAGRFLDILDGDKSTVTGRDNAKNGPDKIVNGIRVQCKYCQTSGQSVKAAFSKNKQTGLLEYRYYNLSDNTPMMLEVPKDQYSAAINAMKKRIRDGQVPGVSTPEAAIDIVKQGKLTYKQVRNLAKAGTFESLTYDAVTGAVDCSFAFGITVLVTFGFTYSATHDWKESLQSAAVAGFTTFGITFLSQVAATQVARTGLTNGLIPLSQEISKKLGPKTVQSIINSFRTLAGQKKIYGAAASKSFEKALRTNAVTQAAMFVVFAIPDTYKFARQQMSGGQYMKNMASTLSSVVGMVAGTVGGAKLGGKLAEKAPSIPAKVVTFSASTVGGMCAGALTTKVGNIIRENDADILCRMFNATVANVCIDYLLNENEIKELLKIIGEDKETKKQLKNVMKKLLSSKNQYQDLIGFLNKIAEDIVSKRPVITDPSADEIADALSEAINNIEEMQKDA